MANRHNKSYIPWHERIDSELVREVMRQFVIDMFTHGIRIEGLEVDWQDEHTFTAKFDGSPAEHPPVDH